MPSVALRPSDKDLLEAVRLKCANCYSALSFANMLGGSKTPAWGLCHTTSLKDLLKEVEE